MMKHTKHVLTYSQDGTARIWDVDTSHEPRTIRHRSGVAGARLSPDEKLLLTWTDKGTARLTELHREDRGEVLGRLSPEYPGHFAWTRLPPDGLRAVTWGAFEKSIRYVDIKKNRTLRFFSLDGDVDSVTLSPDGSHVLATADGSGWFWNLHDEQPNVMIESHESPVVFNDDASQVFVRNKRKEGVLVEVKQRKAIKKFLHAGKDYIDKVVFSGDGIRVFTRGLQHVQVWEIDGDAPLCTFQRDRRISRVVFSAEGKHLITWDESGDGVHLWDVDDNKPRQTFNKSNDFDRAVFSPDAKQILSWSSSHTGTARLWDVETGRLLRIFRRHGHIVQGLFAPDGKRVVTFTWQKKVHLWDPHQEEPLQTLHLTKTARRPVFADGGSSLIIQANDEVIRWNLAANREQAIERQQRDYEIRTATRLDQSGRLRPLSDEEWQRLAGEVSP